MHRSTLVAVLAAAAPAAADPVGLTHIDVEAPHRAAPLEAVVWYPSAPGAVERFGENPVFIGHDVVPDGASAAGTMPVVLLSHGLGGNLRGLGWLAHGLASEGAVVVAVNHPGSTTGDLDPARSLDHGARVRDLGAALDAVAERFDVGRVVAGGFSLGGWTALSMAGLRGDLGGYAEHCAAVGDASTHCADLAAWGVDLTTLDAGAWDADHRDARVDGAFALDPGLVWGLGSDAADGVAADVLLIGFGEGADRLLATNFDASGLTDVLPQAERMVVVPARHWSALPVCKPGGAAIVAAEGEPPICDDPAGANRAAVHAAVVARAMGFVRGT